MHGFDTAAENSGFFQVIDIKALGDNVYGFVRITKTCRRLFCVSCGSFLGLRFAIQIGSNLIGKSVGFGLLMHRHLVGIDGACLHRDNDRLVGRDNVFIRVDGRARQLRLEAIVSGNVDSLKQFEHVCLVVEGAARRGQMCLGFLRIDKIAGDLDQVKVREILEILLPGFGLHPVLPAILIESFVVRIFHRDVVGNNLRQLQLRDASTPARDLQN